MGFKNVRTVLASGNVIFETSGRDPHLDVTISRGLEKAIGFPVRVVLRTVRELRAIIDADPFKSAPSGPEVKLYVTLLAEKSKDASRIKLPTPPKGVLIVRVDPGEIYSVVGFRLARGRRAHGLLEKGLRPRNHHPELADHKEDRRIMNENIKHRSKRLIIFILILAVPAGVFFIFYRMYRDDVKDLKGFMASYERFNQTLSDFQERRTDDLESQALNAVNDLTVKASLRLSSLIKNDGELMDLALEVADLSRRELEGFGTEGYGLLHEKRIASYVRFQELSRHRR
jgi:hypothetical protein